MDPITNRNCKWALLTLAVMLFVITETASGQTPAFSYQGRLTDASNNADGLFDMQFKLFNTVDVGTGTQHGPDVTNPSVQVTEGVFSVMLDFGNVFDGSARFLEISLRPTGSANPRTILSPRQPVTSTPYAVRSATAATADTATNATQLGGMSPASFVQFNGSGNLGIGTSNPEARLGVVSSTASAGNNTAYFEAPALGPHASNIHFGTTGDWYIRSASGAGKVILQDTGGNVGIGTTTPSHRLAIVGGPAWTGDAWGGALELENASAIAWRANTSNVKFGIGRTENGLFFFRTNSPLGTTTNGPIYDLKMDNAGHVGIGNVGISTDLSNAKLNVFTSGYGLGHTDGVVTVTSYIDLSGGWLGTRSNHPLHFFTNSGSARMTFATNGGIGIGTTNPTQARLHVNGLTLNGVYGSSNFSGVWGESDGANSAGLRGTSAGSGGFGVHAVATGDGNSVGVSGESTSSVGYGLFGRAPARGVWGKTTAAGTGVYGDNSGSDSVGYAGYFFGRVNVTGLLSKGAGAFKIDHPLDPENKYLMHSFVESPDMMNIYNGNITTDEEGNATIAMPDWFEALNQDFRYQLTVIGQFAQAIIASKLRQNRFTIRTDKPHVEVSWQVTGIRHDAYARANRIQVEQEKPKNETGYYLHPQVFGQPEEKSVERTGEPQLMQRMKEQREPAQQKPPQQPQ